MTYDISYKLLAIHGVMYLFSLLQGRGNVSWTNSLLSMQNSQLWR
jgi:hypothetical protein